MSTPLAGKAQDLRTAEPVSRPPAEAVRQDPQPEAAPRFSGRQFFAALAGEAGRRAAVMCVLYDRRRQRPLAASLSVREIENVLNITPDDLTFTLWYLKQRGLVKSDERSSLYLTVDGMDHLEKNLPSPEAVAPFLKDGS
jgi:hypothetical protein